MFRITLIFFLLLFFSLITFSQKIISAEEAVTLAIKNSRNISAAGLAVTKQRQLLKGSFNLPNPDFFVESPTGNFYTASITQSIEFPTVYSKQNQLQKQKIGLAEKEKIISEAEIRYQVRQLYLLLQYTDTLQKQLLVQDTVYENISISAVRQFDAGQINYLQKTFTETQYGEIHNQYLQALLRSSNLKNQLHYLTGMQELILVTPLNTDLLPDAKNNYDSSLIITNPSVQLYKQTELVNQKNIELQKNKALPGLAFGYFNQGERSTPVVNRFRFGLTIPLWFGQYKANISAAKTELEISKLKSGGLRQQL